MANLEDEFGDIIQKARSGLGYSVQDVSRLSGVEASILADFEAYRRSPSEDEIRSIAGVLNLNAAKLGDIADGAWSPNPNPWLADSTAMVEIIPVPFGAYSENCYIIGCRNTGSALIVDPGGSLEKVEKAALDAGLVPDAIAITHGHSDHTGGVAQLAEMLEMPTVIGHPLDLREVDDRVKRHPVEDGDSFQIGRLTVRTLHTPGHTPGSVCYLSGLICFVGDTLFAGSLGRAGGREAYRSLLSSVRAKLLSLTENTALLPGHGPGTTVGEEARHNPFF